jgi:hypothetical protein
VLFCEGCCPRALFLSFDGRKDDEPTALPGRRFCLGGKQRNKETQGNKGNKGTSYVVPVKKKNEKDLKNFIFCKNSRLENRPDFANTSPGEPIADSRLTRRFSRP